MYGLYKLYFGATVISQRKINWQLLNVNFSAKMAKICVFSHLVLENC